MPLDAMVNEVVSLVGAVDGIASNAGRVRKYQRLVEDEQGIKEHYRLASGLINSWIVGRELATGKWYSAGQGKGKRVHRIVVMGFRSATKDDDSEKLHQEVTEKVLNALAGAHHLANNAGVILEAPSLELFGLAMFFDLVLCWRAKITLLCEDRTVPVGS